MRILTCTHADGTLLYVSIHVHVLLSLTTGYLLVEFDKFWIAKEPENVMAFPQLKAEFVDQLSWKLRQDDITVLMQINQ